MMHNNVAMQNPLLSHQVQGCTWNLSERQDIRVLGSIKAPNAIQIFFSLNSSSSNSYMSEELRHGGRKASPLKAATES
jgi:hypothetical protein